MKNYYENNKDKMYGKNKILFAICMLFIVALDASFNFPFMANDYSKSCDRFWFSE